MLSALLLLLLLAVAVRSTASLSCALTTEDYNTIKSAYTERNHYEPLKDSKCLSSHAEALQARYGNCIKTLSEVVLTVGLQQDCIQHFASTLYDSLGANVQLLANTLCQNKTFGSVIKTSICNSFTVVGCPTTRDHFRFSILVACHGAVLKYMTPQRQLEYYSTGAGNKVCEKFVTMNWNTCPLNITDVFEFIDPTKEAYTCDTTQTWGVLGETNKYATERDAAKKAYLNMAAITATQKNMKNPPPPASWVRNPPKRF